MRRFIISFILLIITAHFCWGQIPQNLSYQGILTTTSGEPVSDGSYSIVFRIYDVQTDGAPLWSEQLDVEVFDGLFSVILGQENPLNLPFDRQYWLGITMGDSPEMSPRIAMTASAYSFQTKGIEDSTITSSKVARNQLVRAINSLTDNVIIEGGENVFITTENNKLKISVSMQGGNTLDMAYDEGGPGAGRTITADAGAVNIIGPDGLIVQGKVGIGTINGPIAKLDVEGDMRLASAPDAGDVDSTALVMVYGDSGKIKTKTVFQLAMKGLRGEKGEKGDKGDQGDPGPPGPIGGSDGEVIYNNGGTAAGSDIYFDDVNNRIGIGTTNPQSKLDINGKKLSIKSGDAVLTSVMVANTGSGHSRIYLDASDGDFQGGDYMFFGQNNDLSGHIGMNESAGRLAIDMGGTEVMSILQSGKIGIGIASPSQKLHVNGTAQMSGFKMPTGASNNYVLTSDASGNGTWQAASSDGHSLDAADGSPTDVVYVRDNGYVEINASLYASSRATIGGALVVGNDGHDIYSIRRLSGTTSSDFHTIINLPNGWTSDDTHIIAVKIKKSSDDWASYGYPNGSTDKIQVCLLGSNQIDLFHYQSELRGKPYKIVIMKM